MRTIALLLLLMIGLSVQPTAVRAGQGPRLRIVVGNEGYEGLSGLIGVPPLSGWFGAMTIASLGPRDSRFLVFNLQLVNEGDSAWEPQLEHPELFYFDEWSGSVALSGFWRFSLLDLSSNVLARATVPAKFTLWDVLAFRTNAAPQKFGWNDPGIGAGRAAVIADLIPAFAFLDITDTPPVGKFLFVVEADRFDKFRQNTAVMLKMTIVHRNIGDVTVIHPAPELAAKKTTQKPYAILPTRR